MKNEQTKVAIIGTVGLPANYGGFETLTEHLVSHLDKTYDITVYCSGKKYPEQTRPDHFGKAKLKYIPLEANGVQSIFYDSISILHALFYADVLLILGVAGAWLLPFVRWFTNKKVIISIDGIEWKRGKWNILAKCYLFWAESLAVKYSHIDISDNESIQDYTAARYGSLSRIIEYGADHTLKVAPGETEVQKFPFLTANYAFKVCRIEPENNVHEVLAAFASSTQQVLVVVGNWQNSDYGLQLRSAYQSFDNLFLLDPIYDQRQLDVLRGNATFYVHGHSAGGTNPSLVEAMYLGLPILAFNVSYNRTTTEQQALYFSNADELLHLITSTSMEQLKQLGTKMEEIAQRRYVWKKIAEKYQLLILEALSNKIKGKVRPKAQEISEAVLIQLGLGHLKHQQQIFERR